MTFAICKNGTFFCDRDATFDFFREPLYNIQVPNIDRSSTDECLTGDHRARII